MFYTEQWFIHAVNGMVTFLSQQRQAKTTGAYRREEGVVGKTFPFQMIAQIDMAPIATRDGTTQFANPSQTKRRANLSDYGLAFLFDKLDDIKTLTDPESAGSQTLVYARERKMDDIALGAAIAAATVVNEASETTTTSALPSAQIIVDGSTGLTMAKVRKVGLLFDAANVFEEDRFMFVSPQGLEQLLRDPQVTSTDYSGLRALERGTITTDAEWYGMRWRKSTRLSKTGNIRSCIAWQKMGVGVAFGLVEGVRVMENPERWGNPQAQIRVSGGGVRIDDNAVVRIDIDESV